VHLDRDVAAVLARARDVKPAPQQKQDLAVISKLCSQSIGGLRCPFTGATANIRFAPLHSLPRAHAMTPLKPQIAYDDFARLDIRIGKVVEVQPFPRARNPSYKVGVDVGADRIMWTSAQITNYEPAALIGTQVVCVCNLGPKNIAGFTSELLILGANDASGNVIVLGPRSDVTIGEQIY
jgi:tRNA-binding protein